MKSNIIDKILKSEYFKENPPILVDIGASGEINSKWTKIAKYSICLCFDADTREFNISEKSNSIYKKLISINRIVTSENTDDKINFYLTNSPYCSSSLEPDLNALSKWFFSSLFNVEEIVKLNAIKIEDALKQSKIGYIDWFKTDTQGTDLRLYTSLPNFIKEKILVCEFEPGIIDAYKNEDKIFTVMKTMHQDNYWLAQMNVKGTQRLSDENKKYLHQKKINKTIPDNPCWAELTYLRTLNFTEKRNLLLLLVFSLIEKQYGFSLEVCNYALKNNNDSLFEEAKREIINFLNKSLLKNNLRFKIKSVLNKISNRF